MADVSNKESKGLKRRGEQFLEVRTRVWYEYFLVATRDVLSYALVTSESFQLSPHVCCFWSAQYELCKFV